MTETKRTKDKPQPGTRWLPADASAAHINTSVPTFYRRVAAGLLPLPVDLDGLKRWDRLALDAAMEALQKPPLPRVPDAPPRRGRGRPRKHPVGGIFGPEAQP